MKAEVRPDARVHERQDLLREEQHGVAVGKVVPISDKHRSGAVRERLVSRLELVDVGHDPHARVGQLSKDLVALRVADNDGDGAGRRELRGGDVRLARAVQ